MKLERGPKGSNKLRYLGNDILDTYPGITRNIFQNLSLPTYLHTYSVIALQSKDMYISVKASWRWIVNIF